MHACRSTLEDPTLLAEQAAGDFETASVMPIGLVAIVFAVTMVIAVRAGSRIGRGIRLSRFRSAPAAETVVVTDRIDSRERQLALAGPSPSPRVSRALEVIARRDAPANTGARQLLGSARASVTIRDGRGAASPGESGSVSFTPMQRQSRQMRSAPRKSRAASRRDA